MKKRVPTEQEIVRKHGVSLAYVTRQAEVGSTVEREHVTTHEEAYGIALQHIMEFPDYYKHLLPMEDKLKKEWKKKKSYKEMKEAASWKQQAAIAISKKKKMKEDHIPIAMGKMLDSEGGMIKNQLETIERSVELLRAQIKSDDMQIPAWVQAKVTLATENILTCANYMAGKDEEANEEVVYEAKEKKEDEKKFCQLCQKPETRKECSYGEKAWDRFAVPIKSVKKEDVDLSDHFELEEGAAWTRKAGQNKNGGLNEKGRKSYERANPGSDLKAPSKKVGNPRRASFCARMKGLKSKLTSKKTARDPDSRVNKSLRAWNC
jgi:hypothetical protein